jgi:hypothetical protein
MKDNTKTINDVLGSCVGCYYLKGYNLTYYCKKEECVRELNLIINFMYAIINDPNRTPEWCKRDED